MQLPNESVNSILPQGQWIASLSHQCPRNYHQLINNHLLKSIQHGTGQGRVKQKQNDDYGSYHPPCLETLIFLYLYRYNFEWMRDIYKWIIFCLVRKYRLVHYALLFTLGMLCGQLLFSVSEVSIWFKDDSLGQYTNKNDHYRCESYDYQLLKYNSLDWISLGITQCSPVKEAIYW